MRLFISYSRDDKAWTYEFWRALREKTNHDPWIDQKLVPASDWWLSIVESIENCHCFVYILTPKSAESIYRRAELNYALLLNKPVLPILLKSCDYPKILSQRRIQYQTIDDSTSMAEVLLTAIQGLHYVELERLQGKYPAATAERPDVPKPQANSNELVEVFEQAEDALEVSHLTLAAKLFQQVSEADPLGLGKLARKRLEKIHKAQPIVEVSHSQPPVEAAPLISPAFEWVNIPAGKVKIDRKGSFSVPAFAIAKYPVTVAQYELFVQDGGYSQSSFWTPPSWEWRTKKKITTPRYWEDAAFRKPDHPVVGISWYEALAFCRWVNHQQHEKISLPTEQQWQRAAQGDTNWAYPWGDQFDPQRCNSSVQQKSIGTTSTTHYRNGMSPYGVMDLSGNVWEWVLTEYESGQNNDVNNTRMRVLRGGSWGSTDPDDLRVSTRYWYDPTYRYLSVGFRVVSVG